MFRVESLRRKTRVAFAMGQLERLGEVSWVRSLDPVVVRMILDRV